MSENDLLETIGGFADLRILTAGDLLLDHYIKGSTDRTSPEAPVPVVLVSGEEWLAGGAANVARNIAAAGAIAASAGIVGPDDEGCRLIELMQSAGVDTTGVLTPNDCSTIVKTRIVSQGQQIVRLDRERLWVGGKEDLAKVQAAAEKEISNAQAVIISDYGKGYICTEVLATILRTAAAQKIKVFVDPKGRDYARYAGAFAITPNSREAYEATGISTATEAGLRQAAEAIHGMTGCSIVIITRGSEGLALRDDSGQLHLIPTAAREVFDVTGAGDTFVAWITLGITAGLPPVQAAELANIAAGISVSRVGPAVVTPLDIRQALVPGKLGKKIVPEDHLSALGRELRSQGKRIVLANGCFDFLHAGHVAFLQAARALGDVLVVATNSDETIRRLKGDGRPIIEQGQREELLASIEAVDFVVVFGEDTPHELIKALRPDILVKGANYRIDQVEAADVMRDLGGEVRLLPIRHDFHTGQLIR